MSSLIPVHASEHVLGGVSEYLATAFSLANPETSNALKAFLDPTLVITGTGSGKTESFLYPVLDHAARARAEGHTLSLIHISEPTRPY